MLVIDETGDRKYGTHTAHVGWQYLGSLGKVDSGIVTVHVLYDTSDASVPLKFVPYTPAHHFERGIIGLAFKTKPQLAIDLIDAVRADWPYRAVVADSFYGRNEVFQTHLIRQHLPVVLALPASHTWWHAADQPGSVEELALHVAPEAWQPLVRTDADGHQEIKWVAKRQGGPFGPHQTFRLIVVTPDLVELPEERTEYLISNLREGEQDTMVWHARTLPATLLEIAWLYARRPRIEQADREVKQHLGWTHCQARSDLALRRHWNLVCVVFCFLYWETAQPTHDPPTTEPHDDHQPSAVAQPPPTWSAALRRVRCYLEPFVWIWRAWRAFTTAEPPNTLLALLRSVAQGQPLSLYVTSMPFTRAFFLRVNGVPIVHCAFQRLAAAVVSEATGGLSSPVARPLRERVFHAGLPFGSRPILKHGGSLGLEC
ncbi:transposase [Deinococcus sp. QL22]|uniref:IS701 family transposase n=1 Tax=Deinococcus sp. QL22 TaxID=2939437 RepID=UPI00352FF076